MFDFKNFEKGAFLAPMADFTNVAFRTLAHEYGSILQTTELISCKSIIYKNKKTKKMLKVSEKEKPVFLQLFGNNPEDFEKAIKIVEKYFDNFAGYDLNCGCSVPKALKGKYGVYLMDYPMLVGEIISSMKNSTKKPITIKMRLGNKKENFLEVAKEAEKKGVSLITLHARLGKQLYAGKANWGKIKKLKENVSVPVVANGDVNSLENYIKIKKETNCDFVMVGRGAIGNAFLFKQIKDYENQANSNFVGAVKLKLLQQNKKMLQRNNEEIFKEGKKYLDLSKEFNLGINDVRGYFIKLATNFKGAKKLRNDFVLSKTIKELEEKFEKKFSN